MQDKNARYEARVNAPQASSYTYFEQTETKVMNKRPILTPIFFLEAL